MKKFLKIFLGILFLALLVGTFVFLWNKTHPVKVVYTLATPVRDTIRQYVIASGKVEPRDEVLIKPQISGIISEVLCKAGDRVKQGDVIATVKVIPEMGTLNAAESRVTVARLSLDQTRKEFERTEALYAKGVVSQEEFEKGQTTLRQAEEEFQNAEDNLEIVKTGITNRYKDLSNTQIRSTITGMILDVPIKVGNSVIQANTFNDGTTIATVADMGDMLFRGNVDETDIGRLHAGMPVVQSRRCERNHHVRGEGRRQDPGIGLRPCRLQRQCQHRDRQPRRCSHTARKHHPVRRGQALRLYPHQS